VGLEPLRAPAAQEARRLASGSPSYSPRRTAIPTTSRNGLAMGPRGALEQVRSTRIY